MARKRKSRPAASDASSPPKEPPAKPKPAPPCKGTAADSLIASDVNNPKGENNTSEPQQESSDATGSQDAQHDSETTGQDSNSDQGGDTSTTTAAVLEPSPTLAHEETRAQASNRWILEGRRWDTDRLRADVIKRHRAMGATKEEAANVAWTACFAQFPPPGIDPAVAELAPESPAVSAMEEPNTGVSGLGSVPTGWPILPSNASLAAEIQWVQSSRIDVVEELPGGAVRVHLGRADHPAPSKSALGWLETSIRAYSKYCDIAAKATAQQEDEKEHVRRERLAISDVSELLAEMVGEES